MDVIAEIIYIIYGDSCLSASVPGARISGLTFGLHGVHIVRRGFGVHVLHNTTGIARLRAWRTDPTRQRWSVNKYTAYRIVLEISDVVLIECFSKNQILFLLNTCLVWHLRCINPNKRGHTVVVYREATLVFLVAETGSIHLCMPFYHYLVLYVLVSR